MWNFVCNMIVHKYQFRLVARTTWKQDRLVSIQLHTGRIGRCAHIFVGWKHFRYNGTKLLKCKTIFRQTDKNDSQILECIYNILKLLFQVALYTFKAQNDTELSFGKGERLEVIDRPPSDPDWYKARNTSGQIGLVPKNYLVELSQYLTQDVGKKFHYYADFLFPLKQLEFFLSSYHGNFISISL